EVLEEADRRPHGARSRRAAVRRTLIGTGAGGPLVGRLGDASLDRIAHAHVAVVRQRGAIDGTAAPAGSGTTRRAHGAGIPVVARAALVGRLRRAHVIGTAHADDTVRVERGAVVVGDARGDDTTSVRAGHGRAVEGVDARLPHLARRTAPPAIDVGLVLVEDPVAAGRFAGGVAGRRGR